MISVISKKNLSAVQEQLTLAQQITDLEIDKLEQGIQITDLELTTYELDARVKALEEKEA